MKKPTRKNGRPGFGWMPDLPDNRDHLYAAPLAKLRLLPSKVDLRRQCPKVYDQGQIGSCTTNVLLHRREKVSHGELSTRRSHAGTVQGLLGRRLSIRFWLHCLRKLRERGGRQDRRAENTQAEGRSGRRPRSACSRVRRPEP